MPDEKNKVYKGRRWPLPFALGLLCGVAIMAAFITVKVVTGEKGEKMSTDKVTELVKTVDETKIGSIDKVSVDLLSLSREAPRSLIKLMFSKDESLSERARAAFLRMEDTIVVPVLEVDTTIPTTDRVWMIEMAVKAEIQLRRTVGNYLKKMMSDKTLLPEVGRPGMAEGSAPPVRICDEAYLQLRNLVHTIESGNEGLLNRDRFLQKTFDERDEELVKFLKTNQFTNFMDTTDKEDE